MAQSRATIERRQLGTELRRLRVAAGKSQREAAEVIECDTSLISRTERGQRSLKVMELEALLDFYAAPSDSREQIADIAQLARQRRPRRTYADSLPGAFRRLSDHEQDATEIYYWDCELVPGLLQTEDYMRTLMRIGRSAIFEVPDDDIEARVQFRLERQELVSRENPPQMWFVINESALLRPIGGWDVLRKQIHHLLDVTHDSHHVTIQVASLSTMDHPLLGGSIQLLRFGEVVPDIVYQPTFTGGGVYVIDEQDKVECSRAFDRLRAVALGPAASRAFLTQRTKELENA